MDGKRKAMTLIELLVILGILLLLVLMVLPAVMRLRGLSQRMESSNNLRTLMQGMQQYAIARSGVLPGSSLQHMVMNSKRYPLYVILPYMDAGFTEPWGTMGPRGMEYPQVRFYLSPSDLSTNDAAMPMVPHFENASYSTNALVFDGVNKLSTIEDGMSYTIGMSERYRGCFNNGVNSCIFVSRGVYPILENRTKFRTSTFADQGYNDVVPVTVNGISQPSRPDVTFQSMPTVDNADGSLLQSTQSAGLLTIMMDGSIRTFGSGVRPEVFWGAITPRGNERITFD